MHKQPLLRIASFFLCLTLLCAICLPVFADFGDFSGDNDYGGGDYGGDYGGGYDYDYGGGYSYSYVGSSSSRSSEAGDAGTQAVAFILLLFLIIGILAASAGSVQEDESRASGAEELPALEPIDYYSDVDPQFSSSRLEQKLSNLYVQMQQCWQEKDIEPLRPYFTDAYFSQLDRQLAAYRRSGVTNYVDRPAVLRVKLEGWRREDEEDHIYATVKTRIVDYKLNDATGELISGSRTAEKFMTYRYHLTRPVGEVSERPDGLRAVSCPNCGAPLAINETAKCPFCGSIVTAASHDFVIARIEGISQRTEE